MSGELGAISRARMLEIERLRDESKAGLRTVTVEELWDLVEELLPEAELVNTMENALGTEHFRGWRRR